MITLIGHGYVGRAIARELIIEEPAFRWHRHQSWYLATDRDSVVINAAGYTGKPNVDGCEDHPRDCIQGNVRWPLDVEAAAGRVPVIHIGSGCIYQGDGFFSERDEPNFTGSVYSCAKLLAEVALDPYLDKSYVLRLRMPFGKQEHPKNLLTKLGQYPTLVDYRNSLTSIDDAAKAIVWFARNLPTPGIYNLTNPGSVTTREIAEMMGLQKEWFPSEAAFLSTVKAPRSHCTLDTRKLEAIYPMRGVKDALAEAIAALKQRKAA